jgi:hypothetical protein
MILGDPCERFIRPTRGHNPQVENHCLRVKQTIEVKVLGALYILPKDTIVIIWSAFLVKSQVFLEIPK